MDARDRLREQQHLLREATAGRLTRGQIMTRGAALGLGASSLTEASEWDRRETVAVFVRRPATVALDRARDGAEQ